VTGGERAALLDLLARPPLRRLWQAARARLERYGAVRGSVRLDDPDAGERRAVADLLGLRALPPAERPLRVTLAKLDRTLRASRFGVGLKEALELHGGEVRDLPAERAAEEDAWQRFWHRTRDHPLISCRPELVPWLGDVESTGLYRRLAGKGAEESHTLMDRVLAFLAEILGEEGGGGVRLAVLASRVLGDSHALDAGHRVPALVLRALARLHDRPLPATAADRRELWALAGVVCDDLSCDVLVLGLAPAGDGLLFHTLREHAAAGEPVRVTLRQLAKSPPVRSPAPGPMFVCENPAVVAVAADRLGRRSPPLVCLAGQPDTAARVLLCSLVDGGAELRYHGDFDWGGLRIANALSRAVPWTPWRFTAADYLENAGRVEHGELTGRPVDAEWDPALRAAMEETGVAVEEEAVIEVLLRDLSGRAPD
jgi:uncharacterized protein (TIGR02679 family)